MILSFLAVMAGFLVFTFLYNPDPFGESVATLRFDPKTVLVGQRFVIKGEGFIPNREIGISVVKEQERFEDYIQVFPQENDRHIELDLRYDRPGSDYMIAFQKLGDKWKLMASKYLKIEPFMHKGRK